MHLIHPLFVVAAVTPVLHLRLVLDVALEPMAPELSSKLAVHGRVGLAPSVVDKEMQYNATKWAKAVRGGKQHRISRLRPE